MTKQSKPIKTVRRMTYGAISVALSFLLSFIKLFDLPFGGSITAASALPILAYGYWAGVGWGTCAGLVYFLLQLLHGVYFLSPLQFAFDYVLPFTLLGTLPGIFRTKSDTLNLYAGFFAAILARYFCHFFAGVVFWAETAPYTPWLYSLIYNAFVWVDAIPCFVLVSLPPVRKLLVRDRSPQRSCPKKQTADKASQASDTSTPR